MAKGLFKSLIVNPDGMLVAYPGKPYQGGVRLMPSTSPIELDMVFMVYTSKHRPYQPMLEFIKEIGLREKRTDKELIKPVDKDFTMEDKPKDIPENTDTIEEPKLEGPTLDELPDRTKKDADKELQDIAYEIDPVRKSVGFSTLRDRQTTIKDIHKFVTEKRQLHAVLHSNSNSMPVKSEWVSLALHGFTDSIDKNRYQYNTRKWAKKWYTKKVLEELYGKKVAEFDSKKKVADLFEEAWDLGWLKRDPNDIMDGLEIEKA